MILIVDNYDSFTYNLVQLVGLCSEIPSVVRNDHTSIENIRQMKPRGIIISPGPGRPEQAGISIEIIRTLGSTIPILGVCLGHQAIGYVYGGSIVHAPVPMHGKTSTIFHQNDALFSNVSSPFEATRYHSLVISPSNVPQELIVTARTQDGTIMGVRHRDFPVLGIQFHPESILTPLGQIIIHNWLTMTKEMA